MYLQVNEIQQAGTTGFKDVRGDGKWMPGRRRVLERRPVAPRAGGAGTRGGGVPPAGLRVVTARPLLSGGRARVNGGPAGRRRAVRVVRCAVDSPLADCTRKPTRVLCCRFTAGCGLVAMPSKPLGPTGTPFLALAPRGRTSFVTKILTSDLSHSCAQRERGRCTSAPTTRNYDARGTRGDGCSRSTRSPT